MKVAWLRLKWPPDLQLNINVALNTVYVWPNRSSGGGGFKKQEASFRLSLYATSMDVTQQLLFCYCYTTIYYNGVMCLFLKRHILDTSEKTANGPSLHWHSAWITSCCILNSNPRATVFAACFHSDTPSCSEQANAPHPLDCIMVYIYCTDTLGGPLCFSHKAIMHLHGDGWRKKMKLHLNSKGGNPCDDNMTAWYIDGETISAVGINKTWSSLILNRRNKTVWLLWAHLWGSGGEAAADLLFEKNISLVTSRTLPPSCWALVSEAWATSSLLRYLWRLV